MSVAGLRWFRKFWGKNQNFVFFLKILNIMENSEKLRVSGRRQILMLGRVYYGEIRLHTNSSFETCQTADFFHVARVVVPLPHLVTPL